LDQAATLYQSQCKGLKCVLAAEFKIFMKDSTDRAIIPHTLQKYALFHVRYLSSIFRGDMTVFFICVRVY